MYEVEVICIGNELLSGITLNTNAQWLANQITKVGGVVKKIIVVGDDTNEIAIVIRESIKRKPDLIITCGGLGPTYDDKTLLGVSKALGQKLKVNELAVAMITKSYKHRNLKVKLTGSILKMATIPVHSVPVYNPLGTAPAILIHVNKLELISLPGVPSEMKMIFEKKILNQIKTKIGIFKIQEVNYYVYGITESMLSATLTRIVKSYGPHSLYLKTHPQGYANNVPHMRVQIVSKGTKTNQVKTNLSNVSKEIIRVIKKLNGDIVKC
jgi:molybdenum cofactor synthesis domain-containing protein